MKRLVQAYLLLQTDYLIIRIHLIEFVDQHQQQNLRNPKEPLRLLDTYGDLLPLKEKYGNLFHEYQQQERRLEQWQQKISEAARQMDYYTHQRTELSDARLDPSEEDELLAQRHKYQQRTTNGKIVQTRHIGESWQKTRKHETLGNQCQY